MIHVALIANAFLAPELERAGFRVTRLIVRGDERGSGGLTEHVLRVCSCCVLETSPLGYGYLEAGFVAGRGRPVFMIPTAGDVLQSHRALGVTSVATLDELLRELRDVSTWF